jgi:hypothetical protein
VALKVDSGKGEMEGASRALRKLEALTSELSEPAPRLSFAESISVIRIDSAAAKGKWSKVREISAKTKSAAVGIHGISLAVENGKWDVVRSVVARSPEDEVSLAGADAAAEKGKWLVLRDFFSCRSDRFEDAIKSTRLALRACQLFGQAGPERVEGAVFEAERTRDWGAVLAFCMHGNSAAQEKAAQAVLAKGDMDLVREVAETGYYSAIAVMEKAPAGAREKALSWALENSRPEISIKAASLIAEEGRWEVPFSDGGMGRICEGTVEALVMMALDKGETYTAVRYARSYSEGMEKMIVDLAVKQHDMQTVDLALHSTRSDEVLKYAYDSLGKADKVDVEAAAREKDWDRVRAFGIKCEPEAAKRAVDLLAGQGGYWGWEGVRMVAARSESPEVLKHTAETAMEKGDLTTLFVMFRNNKKADAVYRDVVNGGMFSAREKQG